MKTGSYSKLTYHVDTVADLVLPVLVRSDPVPKTIGRQIKI